MSKFFDTKKTAGVVVASITSFLLVAMFTYAATTISTNVNTGGTLTVSGASTLTGSVKASSTLLVTGAVNTYGNTTLGDAAGDAIVLTGNASTTNGLTVGGNFWVNGYATTTSSNGNFATAGTLTVTGATWASSTLQATGAFTTYGDVTLGDAASDSVTITANASTTNALTVGTNLFIGTTASTTNLVVGGDGANGTIAGIVFGTCTLANTTIAASSTVFANCASATGITTGHSVFVEAPSLYQDFIIQSASSTATNTISLGIYNTGETATTTTSGASANTTINFIGIK